MFPTVKFHCTITELINAVKKHYDIDNVVIEDATDAYNAVKNLVRTIELSSIDVLTCKIQGGTAL